MNRFIFICFIAGLLSSCASAPQGEKHSEIQGITHNEKPINVKVSDTKATVLVFLSAKCPCSNSNSDVLVNLVKKYPEFTVLGIHSNSDEDLAMAKKYFKRKKFNFPVIYDQDSRIAKEFGALKTPHVFIINPKGEIIYNGSVTSSSNAQIAKEIYLDTALSEIQQGKQPSEPKKKTLGCYIKLKS